VLGDLPLLGHLFRNETLNGNRNELIISVTPHIISPGQPMVYPGPPLPAIPTPQPLPTLPPDTLFPNPQNTPTALPKLFTPAPVTAAPSTVTPNVVTPSAATPSVAPSASPPAAFTQANTFTFGSPPQNNYADAGDGARIYYATVTPTILSYGKPVSVVAITSTNVTQLLLAYNGVSVSIPRAGPGQWQGSVPFTLVGTPAPTGEISLSLVAQKADGTQAMISVPVTIVQQ